MCVCISYASNDASYLPWNDARIGLMCTKTERNIVEQENLSGIFFKRTVREGAIEPMHGRKRWNIEKSTEEKEVKQRNGSLE